MCVCVCVCYVDERIVSVLIKKFRITEFVKKFY